MTNIGPVKGQAFAPPAPKKVQSSNRDGGDRFAAMANGESAIPSGEPPRTATDAPGVARSEDVARPSKLQDALAAFEKEAHKTPAERARDQILAKHHLSEDGYAALSPDDKREIDQEIVERTKLLMKAKTDAADESPVGNAPGIAPATK